MVVRLNNLFQGSLYHQPSFTNVHIKLAVWYYSNCNKVRKCVQLFGEFPVIISTH